MSLKSFLLVTFNTLYLLPLTALILTSLLFYDYFIKRRLPPGPPSLPLIGNYLTLPKSKAWLTMTSLSKKYGGIYTVYSGLTPRLIISDPEIAYKLLNGRSNKYSSRPPMVVLNRLQRGTSIGTYPKGPSWALRRKILHQFLNVSAIKTYRERQEAEAVRAMLDISQDDGSNWKEVIERFTASTLFTLSYGHRIDSLQSKVLETRLRLSEHVAECITQGLFLVDYIPLLDYLPPFISRWKIPIDKIGDEIAQFDSGLVNIVKEDLKSDKGTKEGKGSLTEGMLQAIHAGDAGVQSLNPSHFAGLPASLFGAGSVTTIKTVSSAVMALILNPRVLLAAQKELDEVVGISRSPTFADEEKLPYLRAVITESIRWRALVPAGFNHATSEDDEFEGYRIPKGTIVSFNTFAMHQNPDYFPLSDEFAPERFLPPSDERFREELRGEKKFPGKHGHSGFGWGRRVCVGADLAHANLYIVLAKLVWGFDLLPTKGVRYEDVESEGEAVSGLKDFPCVWRVRSKEHKEIMEREVKGAQVVLAKSSAFE